MVFSAVKLFFCGSWQFASDSIGLQSAVANDKRTANYQLQTFSYAHK